MVGVTIGSLLKKIGAELTVLSWAQVALVVIVSLRESNDPEGLKRITSPAVRFPEDDCQLKTGLVPPLL
jgi:hypothetical protein